MTLQLSHFIDFFYHFLLIVVYFSQFLVIMEPHISSVDDLVQDSFDPDPPSLANEASAVSTQQNPYLQMLEASSSLKLLQPQRVQNAFDKQGGPTGLFHLFLSRSWCKCMRQWTNKNLVAKGQPIVSDRKFLAYLGLELAMSILQLNEIYHYWQTDMFTGHEDF